MNELRWILLVAGLVLIAGIYVWGRRSGSRTAVPGHERSARVEPVRTVSIVPEAVEVEPEAMSGDYRFDEPELPETEAYDVEQPAPQASVATRREPRLEPRFVDSGVEPGPAPVRTEPRIEARVEPEDEPEGEPTVEIRVEPRAEPRAEPHAAPRMEPSREPSAEERRPAPAAGPTRKPVPQKIVALRVVAPPGNHFPGERLADALQADGFTFGRYQIFHRLDESGRPVVSLASLKEPGTFDPAAMPGAQFRGVALFTVMPGPLPGLPAFDELVVTARALASSLGGQLQDERGGPLSVQRIGQLREEVAEFERARGVDPGA